jgi:hypothetical protein
MKDLRAFCLAAAVNLCVISAFGQANIVVNDPSIESPTTKLGAADKVIIERGALSKVRKALADDICIEEFEPAGVIKGAFSKPNTTQTLVFYQFCQTGNGLGKVGLILIEGGKVTGNYTSEGGWSVGLAVLPDINQNGRDEFALYYSGGMHQGQGGTGVDIMEFTATGLRGIGWFQADAFFDEADSIGWKVSVKKAKVPVFFREKYTAKEEGKWRKTGKPARFSLGKIYSKFVAVK